jgi:DNA-binding SARP family transcriptional activator
VALAFRVAGESGGSPHPDPTTEIAAWTQELPASGAMPSTGLAVRTLGSLTIAIDGLQLVRKDWGYAKARELLVYLTLHPEGRTREQAGAALWPEATAAQLRNVFHVTLHHLRRTLGSAEWVTFERDRYRLGTHRPSWVDARAWEERMVAALRQARRGAPPLAELQDLATAYGGDFLDGELAGEWHLEVRDRLARLHAEGLESLGAALAAAGRHDEAVAAWDALVRREALHEAAYRGLMTARVRAGDRAGAVREFRRLEATLRREEAGRPERETLALFEQVQRGAQV